MINEQLILDRLKCGTSIENIVMTTPGATYAQVARLAGTVSYADVVDNTKDSDTAELIGELVVDAPTLGAELDALAIKIVHKLGAMVDEDDDYSSIGYATKCTAELKTAFSSGAPRGVSPSSSETPFLKLLGK